MALQPDLRAREAVRKALDIASRRHRLVVAAAEAPLAVCILLCGLLLTVLAGTSLLRPAWLLALTCAALAFAAVRSRRRMLSRYLLAQIVDSRLHLYDSLSTACFLLSGSRALTPAAVFQIESCAQIADTVSPRDAFPFERPRTWYLAVALLLAIAACTLFRYAALGALDLRAPALRLTSIAALRPVAREVVKPAAKRTDPLLQAPALPNFDSLAVPSSGQSPSKTAGSGSDPADAIRNLQQQLQSDQKNSAHEGLMDRVGDAMRGLGSQLKQAMDRKPQTANRDATAQKDPSADAATQSASKPSSADRAPAQNENKSGEREAAKAQAQAVENHNGTPLGPADQAAQEKGSDAQSGAGRDEGQKTIQDAEQLKAVGKLEQIIGKRSASITGEMRLAKSSHDQELQTAYSNRVGEHSNRGGEIHHDQVPPQYRDYIRTYMDAVHAAAEKAH